MDIIVLCAFTATLLGLTHWFEWPCRKPPHRLVAYIAGTICLNIPFSCWLAWRGHLALLPALWANVIVGGLAVLLAWGWDTWLNNYRRRVAAEKAADEQQQ